MNNYGSGMDKVAQSVSALVEDILKRAPSVTRATCVSENAIRVDGDGYDLHFDENLFENLSGVSYKPGDRLIVVPVADKRGKILVIGKVSNTVADREFVRAIDILTEELSTNETAGPKTRSVAFSNKMMYNGSIVKIHGYKSGEGSVVFQDSENGTVATIENDGNFEVEIPPEDIGSAITNRLTMSLIGTHADIDVMARNVFVSIESP